MLKNRARQINHKKIIDLREKYIVCSLIFVAWLDVLDSDL